MSYDIVYTEDVEIELNCFDKFIDNKVNYSIGDEMPTLRNKKSYNIFDSESKYVLIIRNHIITKVVHYTKMVDSLIIHNVFDENGTRLYLYSIEDYVNFLSRSNTSMMNKIIYGKISNLLIRLMIKGLCGKKLYEGKNDDEIQGILLVLLRYPHVAYQLKTQ